MKSCANERGEGFFCRNVDLYMTFAPLSYSPKLINKHNGKPRQISKHFNLDGIDARWTIDSVADTQ